MAQRELESPLWGVHSLANSGTVQQTDSTGLAEHVRACTALNTHWRALRYAAETVQGFFAPRIITTGVLLLILMAMAIAAL